MQSVCLEVTEDILQSYKRKSIADLKINETFGGSYLSLRTIGPPFKICENEIHVHVEDHVGNTIIFSYPIVNPEMFLSVGTFFCFLNPRKILGRKNEPMLRCEFPRDVTIIDKSVKPYNEEHVIEKVTSGENFKSRGDELYAMKHYQLALETYLAALKFKNSSNTDYSIYLNIASTYLMLGYFEKCMEYSLKVLKAIPGNVRALYRTGRACYKLRRYRNAKGYFDKVLAEDSSNVKALKEAKKCVKRLEETTGKVDIFSLFTRSQTYPKTCIDCADYVGPLEINPGERPSKGVFAKCYIPTGTLLVVCKALEVDFTSDMKIDNLVNQVSECVQKNPNTFGELVYNLPINDLDDKFTDFGSDNSSDMERIGKIVSRNYLPLLIRNESHDELLEEGTGLFILSSYFNHSCVPNAVWQTYNDILVIHAIQPIPEGNEVRISYQTIKSDYFVRMGEFINRNNLCDCQLCKLDNQLTDLDIVKIRSFLLEYEELSSSKYLQEQISTAMRMKRLIFRLKEIYKRINRFSLQVPLVYMYVKLTKVLLKVKNNSEAMASATENALGSIGLNTRDIMETVRRGENDVFPAGSGTFAYDLVIQLVVVVICANEVRGCLEEAREWLNVLVVLERVCTGGSLAMIKVKYTDIPENLF